MHKNGNFRLNETFFPLNPFSRRLRGKGLVPGNGGMNFAGLKPAAEDGNKNLVTDIFHKPKRQFSRKFRCAVVRFADKAFVFATDTGLFVE